MASVLTLGLATPAGVSPRVVPPPAPEELTPPAPAVRKQPQLPPARPRGQMLYENHCMACHESVVHVRAGRQIASLAQLQARVLHWVNYLHLRWGKEEVEDVVFHLNSRYYKLERP